MRGVAMTEADVVLVIGRKLDYQLGYGSPAVFPNARFVRIADTAGELVDNRRGTPELLATPALALASLVEHCGNRKPAVDAAWVENLRRRHLERSVCDLRRRQIEVRVQRLLPRHFLAGVSSLAAHDRREIALRDGEQLVERLAGADARDQIGMFLHIRVDPLLGARPGPGVHAADLRRPFVPHLDAALGADDARIGVMTDFDSAFSSANRSPIVVGRDRSIQLEVLEGGGVLQGFEVRHDRCVRQRPPHVGLDPLEQLMASLDRPASRHQHMERDESARPGQVGANGMELHPGLAVIREDLSKSLLILGG
jgi:hypothetical protein